MAVAVQARNESKVTTAGNSHDVALPANIAAGDMLVVIFSHAVAVTVNSIAGWTELVDDGVANGITVLYKQSASGSEGATLTLTTSGNTKSAHVSYRITGHDGTTAPTISTVASGASNPPNASNCNPGTSKAFLWITFFVQAGEEADDDTWCGAAPTGFGTVLQKTTDTGGQASTNCSLASAEYVYTASQLDAAAWGNAAQSLAWRAHTIAIWPGLPVVDGSVTIPVVAGGTRTGKVEVHGAATVAAAAGVAAAGLRIRFGTVTMPVVASWEVIGKTPNFHLVASGTVVAAAVNGTVVIPVTFGGTRAGRVEIHASATIPVVTGGTRTGHVEVHGAVTIAVLVTPTITGTRVAAVIEGAATLHAQTTVAAAAQVTHFATCIPPPAFTFAATGTREAHASASIPCSSTFAASALVEVHGSVGSLVVVSDDFNRGPTDDLGANWLEIDRNLVINSSNQLATDATIGVRKVKWVGTSVGSADQYCQAARYGSSWHAPLARCTGTTPGTFRAYAFYFANGQGRIGWINQTDSWGAYLDSGTISLPAWQMGDVARIEVEGQDPNIVIRVYYNGILKRTLLQSQFSDQGAILNSGEPGLFFYSTSPIFDDFAGGSLYGGGIAVTATLAATGTRVVLGAATIACTATLAATGTVVGAEKTGTASIAAQAGFVSGARVEQHAAATLSAQAGASFAARVEVRGALATLHAQAGIVATGTIQGEQTGAATLHAQAGLAVAARVEVRGVATFGAHASISCAGLRVSAGTANMPVAAHLQAAGRVEERAGATLAAHAGLQAAGTPVRLGGASIHAQAGLVATGTIPSTAEAILRPRATLTVAGTVTRTGTATLHAQAGLQAGARVEVRAAASLHAIAALQAAGTRVKLGAATFHASASMSAVPSLEVLGSVGIPVYAWIDASGWVEVRGGAVFGAHAGISCSASGVITGAATIGACAQLSASAIVQGPLFGDATIGARAALVVPVAYAFDPDAVPSPERTFTARGERTFVVEPRERHEFSVGRRRDTFRVRVEG